jgi:hypothetical protein
MPPADFIAQWKDADDIAQTKRAPDHNRFAPMLDALKQQPDWKKNNVLMFAAQFPKYPPWNLEAVAQECFQSKKIYKKLDGLSGGFDFNAASKSLTG